MLATPNALSSLAFKAGPFSRSGSLVDASCRHLPQSQTVLESDALKKQPKQVTSVVAVLLGLTAHQQKRRRHTLKATEAERALARKDTKKAKELEVEMLEGALLQLFDRGDDPDIYKVREILMRLAKTNPRPNQTVAGDWIIFWASREGCVDKLFGTGMTNDGWWMKLQEYLIKFGSRKGGRILEAAEVIRKVGPYPNQSNSLKGIYTVAGTNRLQITFNEMKTDGGSELPFPNNEKEKVIVLDVVYSSPKMVCLQWEDENGECDFYVLTPVENIYSEVDRLVGTTRARYFFN